jgi:hypothetical protein
MQDAWLDWGGDLVLGPTGDLGLADGTYLGQQRVLRRLLTNAGDYVWQLGYGAGLGAAVGRPLQQAELRGLIRSQMLQEASVARTPDPVVTMMADGAGSVSARLQYVDAASQGTEVLSFPVSG